MFRWSYCCWSIQFEWSRTFGIILPSWTWKYIHEIQMLVIGTIFQMCFSRCGLFCSTSDRWSIRKRRILCCTWCCLAWSFQFRCFCLSTIERNFQQLDFISIKTKFFIRWFVCLSLLFLSLIFFSCWYRWWSRFLKWIFLELANRRCLSSSTVQIQCER